MPHVGREVALMDANGFIGTTLRCPALRFQTAPPKDGPFSEVSRPTAAGQCRYRFHSRGQTAVYYAEAVKTQAVRMYVEGVQRVR